MDTKDPRREMAKKKIEEKKQARRKQMYLRMAVIGAALLVLAGILLWVFLRGGKDSSSVDPSTAVTDMTEAKQAVVTAEKPAATTEARTEAATEKKILTREAHVTLKEGLPTIDEYLGSQHLYNWMVEHFNDYYFKTPYIGIWEHVDHPEELMQPFGEYGEKGGMNCSGFITHLFYSTGGDLKKLEDMGLEAKYGDADTYLYLALRDLVQYETFDSVEEMLKSGKARKGDLIYLYPKKEKGDDEKEPQKKPDCHMGIFWGETSSENKMWSSSRAGNTVTEITMYDPIGKVYLFPVNGN